MKGTQTEKNQLKIFGNYLITPIGEILKFLQLWKKYQDFNKFKLILDPCAGGLKKTVKPIKMREAFLEPGTPMSYPEALVQFGLGKREIITNDIRINSPAQYHLDYLDLDIKPKPDLIITNPPFFYIKEIVRKAYQDVKNNGCIVFLVASTFFTSIARYQLWQELIPDFCFFHTKRMSFWPNKGLDYLNYMHVVWIKHERPEITKLILVP